MSEPLLGAGLLVPEPGVSGTRTALSGMLKKRAEHVLALPWASVPEGRSLLSAIVAALRAHPAAVFAALRRTSVHVHFEAARHGEPGPLLRAGAATLLAELAVAGALGVPVAVPSPPRRVVLRSRRVVLDVDGPLELEAGRITSRGRDLLASASIAHVPIEAVPSVPDVVLARVDDNPLAMEEAHPDKEGNALSLGGHAEAEWIASLADALRRTVAHLPAYADELALGLQQVVPVGFHERRHLSASYREAVGTIYMTLHPDPMTMTEALVHEFQHNKLNAALDLDPFLENAFDDLVVSPVRPDPRPLHGVLLAVHAFLPIAELYLRMRSADDPVARTPRFADRFGEIVRLNHEGLTTVLAHARPTEAGARMIDEMKVLDARHRAAL